VLELCISNTVCITTKIGDSLGRLEGCPLSEQLNTALASDLCIIIDFRALFELTYTRHTVNFSSYVKGVNFVKDMIMHSYLAMHLLFLPSQIVQCVKCTVTTAFNKFFSTNRLILFLTVFPFIYLEATKVKRP